MKYREFNSEFYIRVMPQWKLKFWWRDWDEYKLEGPIVTQRYWKLQIGPLQFVFWHKK